MSRHVRSLGIAMLLGSVGCSTSTPRPPVTIPPNYQYASSAPSSAETNALPWWDALGDSTLVTLVRRTRHENLDLQAARARVNQAEALARQARSLQFPQVMASGSAAFAHSISGVLGDSDTLSLNASLPVSYEVDWFQRHGRNARAADDDANAARLEVEAAAVTMTAQVAEAYFGIRESEARREKLTEHLEINRTFLELMELRYQQGLTSAVDLLQQRQLVLGTETQLRTSETAVALSQQRLSALLGPSAVDTVATGATGVLPTPPPLPPVGIPERLLESRPDLRAARLRVRAADSRVGSALAARLPALFLSGTVSYVHSRTEGQTYGATDTDMDGIPDGFGPVEATTTTDGVTWNAGAQLQVPLFDGGRGRANQQLYEALLEEAVHSYGQSTRTAIAEVESALAQEAGTAATLHNLEAQVELARQTVESARARYREGLTEYLQVLTAVSALQQAELGLVSTRRRLLSDRVQLYRALGGAWTAELLPTTNESGS